MLPWSNVTRILLLVACAELYMLPQLFVSSWYNLLQLDTKPLGPTLH
jgi:hypothetical protein